MHYRITSLLLAAAFLASSAPADEPKPASMLGTEAGHVRDDNGPKMKFAWCLLGTLTMEQVEYDDMGRAKSITPVRVLLTRGFWLGKFEVTQAEWKWVMETEPWKGQKWTAEGPDMPATYINWTDAMAFCRNLTDRERTAGRLPDGWEYTLPTEAQWEHACRAQSETKFSFGDNETLLGDFAWFRDNAIGVGETYAHRVGQKKPNPWGLFDMHGNVYEWCRDWYGSQLPGGRDPQGVETGDYRLLRGGGFSVAPVFCTSASRHGNSPQARFHGSGFRVALTPVRPAAENPAK